ncbi:MAG TPA: protein kinase, partial [Burkholderiales bacterium]|nr:protein kinase [Burkholderiales bacterium]
MISPATGNALPVNYKLGEYAIQAILGQGGFGITYLAHDSRLNTQVAIKEYFPQAYAVRTADATIQPHSTSLQQEHYEWGLNEFLKEAQALARFKHAHIVRVLRFLEENNTAYMVMEYEEGESLLSYLKR